MSIAIKHVLTIEPLIAEITGEVAELDTVELGTVELGTVEPDAVFGCWV